MGDGVSIGQLENEGVQHIPSTEQERRGVDLAEDGIQQTYRDLRQSLTTLGFLAFEEGRGTHVSEKYTRLHQDENTKATLPFPLNKTHSSLAFYAVDKQPALVIEYDDDDAELGRHVRLEVRPFIGGRRPYYSWATTRLEEGTAPDLLGPDEKVVIENGYKTQIKIDQRGPESVKKADVINERYSHFGRVQQSLKEAASRVQPSPQKAL